VRVAIIDIARRRASLVRDAVRRHRRQLTRARSSRPALAGDSQDGLTERDLVAGSQPSTVDARVVDQRSVRSVQIDD
jgi:hypothetical protein